MIRLFGVEKSFFGQIAGEGTEDWEISEKTCVSSICL